MSVMIALRGSGRIDFAGGASDELLVLTDAAERAPIERGQLDLRDGDPGDPRLRAGGRRNGAKTNRDELSGFHGLLPGDVFGDAFIGRRG